MDELSRFAAAAAPALVGTFVGAVLAFLSNFFLARLTAKRQWRTERLSSFVKRAYEMEPGFEAVLVKAERGDIEDARLQLRALVLRQDAGMGRAWQENPRFREAASTVLRKKAMLTMAIEASLGEAELSDFADQLEDFNQCVLELDNAAESFLFGGGKPRRALRRKPGAQ
jgi:hypothetical protein